LTYVNDNIKKIFNAHVGDIFLETLPEHRREPVIQRILSLTKERPVSSYVERSTGNSIRWTNRIIIKDSGKNEYEGIGWILKEKKDHSAKMERGNVLEL
jgi:hypothetical protein